MPAGRTSSDTGRHTDSGRRSSPAPALSRSPGNDVICHIHFLTTGTLDAASRYPELPLTIVGRAKMAYWISAQFRPTILAEQWTSTFRTFHQFVISLLNVLKQTNQGHTHSF
jgi:hypothetical protein